MAYTGLQNGFAGGSIAGTGIEGTPVDPASTGGSLVSLSSEVTGTLAAVRLDAAVPRWKKVTKVYTDFSVAGLTKNIEIYSLGAGETIHAAKMKHSTQFDDDPTGTISSVTMSLGIATDLDKYTDNGTFNVFQAPGNNVEGFWSVEGTENHAAATSIKIAATAVGAFLNTLTRGSVDVWLLIGKAI